MRTAVLARFPAAFRTAALLVALSGAALRLPATARAEAYELDPAHSRIGFSVSHLGLTKVRGRFTNYTGRITLEEGDMASLAAQATIRTASIDTDVAARDKHLRSEDFFDAQTYPEIVFDADETVQEEGQWVLVGTLTMHGTSEEIRLPVTVEGPIEDPWGNRRIGLTATKTIDRQDYGVGSDKPVDKMVGDQVTLELTLEATAGKEPAGEAAERE